MNTLATRNAAKTALAGAGKPVYFGDTLDTDANGLLQPPKDAAFYVLHLITGNPTHEWGDERYASVRIQLDAWSTTEGEGEAMLATATSSLLAARFTPGTRRSLGRYRRHTGAAQDWERTE